MTEMNASSANNSPLPLLHKKKFIYDNHFSHDSEQLQEGASGVDGEVKESLYARAKRLRSSPRRLVHTAHLSPTVAPRALQAALNA